jgi:hypothetical protein
MLTSRCIISPETLKAATSVEIAAVLTSIALVPVVCMCEVELDATEAEYPGEKPSYVPSPSHWKCIGMLGRLWSMPQ